VDESSLLLVKALLIVAMLWVVILGAYVQERDAYRSRLAFSGLPVGESVEQVTTDYTSPIDAPPVHRAGYLRRRHEPRRAVRPRW
jgi:hypothetical protein